MIPTTVVAVSGNAEAPAVQILVDPQTPNGVKPLGDPDQKWALDLSEEFNHPVKVIDRDRGLVAFHPGGGVWDTSYPSDTFTGGRYGANSHNLVAPYNIGGVSTHDGALRLTAEANPLPKNLNPDWPLSHQSGLVSSYPFRIKPYGFYEARMKMPGDKAAWPAFWLFYDVMTFQQGAPPDEIDIMECFFSATQVAANAHFEGAQMEGGVEQVTVQNWNVYGLRWTPDGLTWYVNGVEYARTTQASSTIDTPLFLILNHAMTDPKDGSPTPRLSRTEVDYVRVWEYVEPVIV